MYLKYASALQVILNTRDKDFIIHSTCQYITLSLFFMCLDDAVIDFDRVYQVESRTHDEGKSLLNSMATSNEVSWVDDWQVSGSLMEGCFSPSFFAGNGSLKTGGTLAMDIDAEMNIAELPDIYRKCVIDDINPGFTQMQVMNNGCDFSERVDFSIENKSDVMDKDGFLLPNKVKDYILRTTTNKVHNQIPFNTNIEKLSAFFQAPIDVISFYENVTKATYLQQYHLYVQDKFYLFLSFDIATTFRLAWMSNYTKIWMKRKRLWPRLELLTSELNTSYIITKPSYEQKNNKLTRELRYSFSHIERKIISMQSNEQRVVYFISKTIFYSWVKPLESDKVQ